MEQWQSEYLAEYKRVNGKSASLEREGSWYYIVTPGNPKGAAYRKKDIMRAISVLKARPPFQA